MAIYLLNQVYISHESRPGEPLALLIGGLATPNMISLDFTGLTLPLPVV